MIGQNPSGAISKNFENLALDYNTARAKREFGTREFGAGGIAGTVTEIPLLAGPGGQLLFGAKMTVETRKDAGEPVNFVQKRGFSTTAWT